MERRATITLNWRPAGEPARRIDDFAEVPHHAANDALPPAPLEVAGGREIGSRLDNWGRWAKSAEGPFAAACMAGAICESLRRAAEGSARNMDAGARSIDSSDAVLIGRAMVEVTLDQRKLLGLLYVDGARKGYIAALLRFHPHEFDKRLTEAQDALVAALSLYQNSNSK